MKQLLLFTIVLAVVSPVAAVPLWSLDFESGWAASSGTPEINFGSLSDRQQVRMSKQWLTR